MEKNIIDRLKLKEEEMAALIEEARREADSIKGEALRKAADIRSSGLKETDEAAGLKRKAAEKEIAEEVRLIEEEARAGAAELGEKGLSRMERALKFILKVVAEGTETG